MDRASLAVRVILAGKDSQFIGDSGMLTAIGVHVNTFEEMAENFGTDIRRRFTDLIEDLMQERWSNLCDRRWSSEGRRESSAR